MPFNSLFNIENTRGLLRQKPMQENWNRILDWIFPAKDYARWHNFTICSRSWFVNAPAMFFYKFICIIYAFLPQFCMLIITMGLWEKYIIMKRRNK